MNVPLNVNNEIKFILKKRDMLSEKMSDEISDSWARCVSSGLNPFSNPKKIVISPQELKEARQKKEALRKIIIPELELLYSQVAGTNFMVAFSNEEGLVLDTIFDKSCLKEDVGKSVIPGSIWSEKICGTNGLGLATKLKKSTIVSGKEPLAILMFFGTVTHCDSCTNTFSANPPVRILCTTGLPSLSLIGVAASSGNCVEHVTGLPILHPWQ